MEQITRCSGIGSRIRSARLAAKKTNAAEFAREVGIQPHTLWRYEMDQSRPGIDVTSAIAKALGVTTDWLLTGEGDGPVVHGASTVAEETAAREAC